MSYVKALYGVILAPSLVANSLVLFAQYQLRRRPQHFVNVFIASIAGCDFLFGLSFIVTELKRQLGNQRASDSQSQSSEIITRVDPFSCLVVPYIQLVCNSFNALCMIAVAIELFRAVFIRTVSPMTASATDSSASGVNRGPSCVGQRHSRRSKAIQSVIVVWILSVVYSLRIIAMYAIDQSHAEMSTVATTTPRSGVRWSNYTSDVADISLSTSFVVATSTDFRYSLSTMTGFGNLFQHDIVTSLPVFFITSHNYVASSKTEDMTSFTTMTVDDITAAEEGGTMYCDLLEEFHSGSKVPQIIDITCLFVMPIVIQLILYVAVARKVWSSQVTSVHCLTVITLYSLNYDCHQRIRVCNMIFIAVKRLTLLRKTCQLAQNDINLNKKLNDD